MTLFGCSFEILPAVLFLVGVAVVIVGYVFHKDEKSPFNVVDLFLEGGKASWPPIILAGSWALSSWVIVYAVLHDKMTEGYLGLYAAIWIVPAVVKLITGGKSLPKIDMTGMSNLYGSTAQGESPVAATPRTSTRKPPQNNVLMEGAVDEHTLPERDTPKNKSGR